MQSSAATMNALVQMFVLSMVVERIVAVLNTVFTVTKKAPDASPSWGALGTIISFFLGLVICFSYTFDLINIVTDGKAQAAQSVGIVLTAAVIAGGSAGVRKIIDALSDILKANKSEARIRILEADKMAAKLGHPTADDHPEARR